MPKTKSERLKVVVDLAQRQEEAAADQLLKAKRYYEQQCEQRDTLRSYLDDYVAKMKQSMSGVKSVSELQQRQGFIQQINAAIQQQELVVDHAKVLFDQAKSTWLSCKDKADSLARIRSDAKVLETIEQDKKTEKLIQDEFQSRRAFVSRES